MIAKQLTRHRLLHFDAAMLASRVVLVLFLLTQACDGAFTYTAVRAYGIAAEGNMVLATWMALVGPFPTLFVAKMVAAGGGVLLYARGIHRTLALLTLLYLLGAIGPWILVFQAQ
jgi:hypothetical protein